MTLFGGKLGRGSRVAAGATMIFALASCVTESEFVNLSYPPTKKTEHTDVDPSNAARSSQFGCSMTVNVSDERPSKGRIGTLVGGLVGEFRTPVLTGDSAEVWVHDAFSFELGALGFNVSDSGISDDRAEVSVMNVAITEITSSCYAVSCSASMDLTVTLTQPSGETRIASQHGEKGASGLGFSYLPIIEEALRRSLREAIHLTFDDLQMRPWGLCGSSGDRVVTEPRR